VVPRLPREAGQDNYYTAANEPTAMSTWRNDMNDASVALNEWVNVGVGWQIREHTTLQLKQQSTRSPPHWRRRDSTSQSRSRSLKTAHAGTAPPRRGEKCIHQTDVEELDARPLRFDRL